MIFLIQKLAEVTQAGKVTGQCDMLFSPIITDFRKD